MTLVYLSLGSNIGERQTYLQRALEELAHLSHITLQAVSPICLLYTSPSPRDS